MNKVYISVIPLIWTIVTASNRTAIMPTIPYDCSLPGAFSSCASARMKLCGIFEPTGKRASKIRRVQCARFCLSLINWHLKCQENPVVSLYLGATMGCWIRCFTLQLTGNRKGLIFIESSKGKVEVNSAIYAA